ncbi:MAG TPA: hypothetical protein VLZ05_05460 [Mycobacterium sp.]|nr:hypothetical protein [Mycobacterium sp.]HUH68361.1 hypothetical protein [Mycobacterium sp.]
MIARNPDLLERDLLKRAALTAAMAQALRERGVSEPTASLAAELGDLAFNTAYSRWLDPANRQTLTDLVAQALQELSAATQTLR